MHLKFSTWLLYCAVDLCLQMFSATIQNCDIDLNAEMFEVTQSEPFHLVTGIPGVDNCQVFVCCEL